MTAHNDATAPWRRFSIGYHLPDDRGSIVDLVRDYGEHVGEVYFALPGEASGRAALPVDETEVFYEELSELAGAGLRLVVLYNAACYGEEGISVALVDRTKTSLAGLLDRGLCHGATTTSPFLARAVKQSFPGLEVRASINMRIGTVKGMEYLAAFVDGYYMQREYNRDLARIEQLRAWCAENGKSLHMLANSGCLRFCSYQNHHDNLVAHEAGVIERENVALEYPAFCWEYLRDRRHWPAILQNTWVRPEDLRGYLSYFDGIKLATRMHSNPRLVVHSYANGRFYGNLLDLMEPGYAPLLYPHIIDNSRFPADWLETVTSCGKECHRCSYCADVLEHVLVRLPDVSPLLSR